MDLKSESLSKKIRIKITYFKLTILIALYYALVINIPFYVQLYDALERSNSMNIGLFLCMPIFIFLITNVLFCLISWPYITKPLFIFLLLTSSIVSYVIYNYGISVDYGIIQNAFETDTGEAASYLSFYSVFWVAITGIIPSLMVALVKIRPEISVIKKSLSIFVSVLVILSIVFFYFKDLSYIGRKNSYLKEMIVPTYYLSSSYKYIKNTYFSSPVTYKKIGEDAKQAIKDPSQKPTLFFFVLGETARSQNYQLNGYPRPTNEYTSKQDVISFRDVASCGTATAVSVPCMFSALSRDEYKESVAKHQDNAIDILKRAGISLLWKENDGGDKDVANNITKTTLNREVVNEFCNGNSCYDMALLDNLDSDIKNMEGDRVIFIHLMGSHGPNYFKRYPDDQKKFTPDCQRNDVENCSSESIINSYDNTIHYTDFVISKLIDKLKGVSDQYNTSLLYLSDHGESLGENGVFLHGLPYAFAPIYQTRVPLMLWMSDDFKKTKNIDQTCLKNEAQNSNISQDYIFHSLLGIMDVKTSIYDQELDLYKKCRKNNEKD
ncbi:phosphoethanolamine transferase [Marinomonas sp. BSi20584]|uniref:phosphoethanolamine transferase n=1 Tax=Marinomonas sp. BSi20584 TaxID=1594462 RepID=UPI000C1E91EC|nr:phosphoethanolamine--lipid A transferase [Marinomonas sp. BSi20584]PJE54411.1 hydrolase [Marinomonas sp. BSi20584]